MTSDSSGPTRSVGPGAEESRGRDRVERMKACLSSQPEHRTAGAGAEWLTPGRFAFILAACIFAAYPEVVLGVRTFFFRDFGFFGYPLAFHHRESIWHGEIPLWNPLNNCGLPFLSQWNSMALYPGSLLYLVLPL